MMKVVSDFVDPSGAEFDQGSVNGKGHAYIADNNGHLEFVDYSKTKLVGDPSNFHAAPFLSSSLDNVAPLVGLGSLGILTDVSENLAPTGFTLDAKSITPTPSASSATNVEWFGNIALTDASAHDFRLSGSVANVAPGEVREISTGSTVIAQATVASGQQLTNTINLPPGFVAGQHIISLSPPRQTVDRNATATYVVTLTNPLPTSETYTPSTTGLDGLTTSLATSVVVPAGQSVTTPLAVTVPASATAGTRIFLVSVTSTDGATDSTEGQLSVSPTVAIANEAVNLQISPARKTVGQGTSATFDLLVTNAGDVASTYSLAGVFPVNINAAFSTPSITVAPGAGNARQVVLTFSASNPTAPGSFPFSVSAVSTTDPNANSTASAAFSVVNLGVQVMLTPPSANPGNTLRFKVTNTGTVADTYFLTLGGPAALVSSLAMDHVTLGPGASVVVPITTTTVNFAVPGSLNLIAAATSQANPAVQSVATSALNIAGTHGLGSSLAPAVKVLPIPGTTDFLLEVNNTGNVEDSYSAVITGTSGPLTANLMGPEGNLTQTIPLFRLPGLSTGAILIHAGIASTATGTVSVRVTSIGNPAMTTSQTATLAAVGSTATTTQLTVAPNPSAVGEPIAVVAPATGAGKPTGSVTFTLDGAAQAPVSLQPVNGQDEATFTTSSLGGGPNTISASYGGDPQFTASEGGPSTLAVRSQQPAMTSSSALVLTPNPSTGGHAVTFTAIVSPTTGTATPTGTVTFRIDGVAQVPVRPVTGGRDVATFTTSALLAGSHAISASYSGDSRFNPSLAIPVVQVAAAGSTDGPRVVNLQRFGFHQMPTTLVLTFDGPLDSNHAQNIDNYEIVDAHGHEVAVKSANDYAATGRIVLHTKRRRDVHRSYQFTVRGTGPNGVSDGNGLLLDGNRNGAPGGDYHSVIDRSKSVIGAATPKFGNPKGATRTQRA